MKSIEYFGGEDYVFYYLVTYTAVVACIICTD